MILTGAQFAVSVGVDVGVFVVGSGVGVGVFVVLGAVGDAEFVVAGEAVAYVAGEGLVVGATP